MQTLVGGATQCLQQTIMKLYMVVLIHACCHLLQVGSESLTQPSHIEVYKAGDLGYECFRIPSLLFTSKGTLLAFAEGRGQHSKSCADRGDVHIVLKRSTDYGNTWSDMTVVHIEANHTIGRLKNGILSDSHSYKNQYKYMYLQLDSSVVFHSSFI